MVVRQWGREMEGKLEPPFCGSPLGGTLWSHLITKIPFRSFGPISAQIRGHSWRPWSYSGLEGVPPPRWSLGTMKPSPLPIEGSLQMGHLPEMSVKLLLDSCKIIILMQVSGFPSFQANK